MTQMLVQTQGNSRFRKNTYPKDNWRVKSILQQMGSKAVQDQAETIVILQRHIQEHKEDFQFQLDEKLKMERHNHQQLIQ